MKERLVPDLKFAATAEAGGIIKRFMVTKML